MNKPERCKRCGKVVHAYDSIIFTSENDAPETVCMRCANNEMAEKAGIKFEHPEYLPMTVRDFDGIEHEFHFVTRFLSDIVSLEAVEIKAGMARGYEFSVIGRDPEADTLDLYGKLVDRIKRSLAIRHLKSGDFGYQIADPWFVRARISSIGIREDDSPLLIIDGKEITWDDFGRMILTFEGFQFKMEVYDRSEER